MVTDTDTRQLNNLLNKHASCGVVGRDKTCANGASPPNMEDRLAHIESLLESANKERRNGGRGNGNGSKFNFSGLLDKNTLYGFVFAAILMIGAGAFVFSKWETHFKGIVKSESPYNDDKTVVMKHISTTEPKLDRIDRNINRMDNRLTRIETKLDNFAGNKAARKESK